MHNSNMVSDVAVKYVSEGVCPSGAVFIEKHFVVPGAGSGLRHNPETPILSLGNEDLKCHYQQTSRHLFDLIKSEWMDSISQPCSLVVEQRYPLTE
ncbi:hypothetical protein Tco_0344923 [Tanacetum coccineum]